MGMPGESCVNHSFCFSNYCRLGHCGWEQSVISGPLAYERVVVAVDSADRSHVLFEEFAGADSGVILSSRTPDGGWSRVLVTRGTVQGASMAIDQFGQPALTVFSQNNLKLWRLNNATWSSQLIPGTNTYGDSALAFDRGGSPHVAYFHPNSYTARYAVRDGGMWSTTVLGSTGEHGVGLALDSMGSAHVCFDDYPNRRLMYATNQSGAWVSEVAASFDAGLQNCAIAVDAKREPHLVAYVNNFTTEERTVYATRTTNGTWALETLRGGGSNDGFIKPSIFINPAGVPVVGYRSYDNSSCWIALAWREAASWQMRRFAYVCGSVGSSGMALESNGTPVFVVTSTTFSFYR